MCPEGHQLFPVQLTSSSRFSWICDECDYQTSPEEDLDQEVPVWRCRHDWRLSQAEQAKMLDMFQSPVADSNYEDSEEDLGTDSSQSDQVILIKC